jgi:hypothetical protein
MSTEHRESDLIRSWLDESYEAERDPHHYLDHLLDEVPTTPQRRRHWWHLARVRRARIVPAATDTTEFPPRPIAATNGRFPTVIGRTTSMLSPVKAIIAGAIVFALGGAFLIAQPFDQQQSSLPGAEAEAVAPTWVTGEVRLAPSCSGPDIESDGVVTHQWNHVCSPQTWTASDPRLSGEVAASWNEDVYQTDDGPVTVNVQADFLHNDGGEWMCSTTSVYEQVGALTGVTSTCVGQGGYDGLSAVLVWPDDVWPYPFAGLIFSGDLPPVPEPPAVE